MTISTRHHTSRAAAASHTRFVLYSHDGLGLGHIRRNLNLATALVQANPDASILLATGAEDLDAFTIPAGVDVVRFPGLRKVGNQRYTPRRLHLQTAVVHDLRAGLLASAVEAFAPDVIVADRHPGGVGGELLPALRLQHESGRKAVLGLRDVLDSPVRVEQEWMHGTASQHVERYFDRILIYGQQDLLDPFAQTRVPAVLRQRATFCGYVVQDDNAVSHGPPPFRGPRPVVLATSGGGEDGMPLLHAVLDAAVHAWWRTVVVTGPHMDPGARRRLSQRAEEVGAELRTSVPDLGRHLGAVDAVVCMGGYNTLTEVMAAGVPAVCVPRVVPRTEQLIRAEALGRRGLLHAILPNRLTVARLRQGIVRSLDVDRQALRARIDTHMSFDGAATAARLLHALARPAASAAPAPPTLTPHFEVPA